MSVKELLAGAALALVLSTGAHAQTQASPWHSAGVAQQADSEAPGRAPRLAANTEGPGRARYAANTEGPGRARNADSEGPGRQPGLG